ncbi:uncharacterized protein LOC134256327 [Saccostrea cucullata]|uniref:uncharacterized protein LOC134256327 n=1 Tax=Saccostrea cuccullata TaxID=36930 RepID=UPI002ED175CE
MTSPSIESTTEHTTMASTSNMSFPTTAPNNTTSEDFTTLSSTVRSTTGQSTIILSTTSGSIPTDTSTQSESTTKELDDATESPVQRAVQQIDDFIKENYKYFIIGFVFVGICSVLLGILIYRKCVKSKKPENLEHWHPQRGRDLTTANHLSNQTRHKNPLSAYSVEQKTSSDGFKFYKYVESSKI